jgi:hypothetical protein
MTMAGGFGSSTNLVGLVPHERANKTIEFGCSKKVVGKVGLVAQTKPSNGPSSGDSTILNRNDTLPKSHGGESFLPGVTTHLDPSGVKVISSQPAPAHRTIATRFPMRSRPM